MRWEIGGGSWFRCPSPKGVRVVDTSTDKGGRVDDIPLEMMVVGHSDGRARENECDAQRDRVWWLTTSIRLLLDEKGKGSGVRERQLEMRMSR